MKYLCLVYADESRLYAQPDSPNDAECLAVAEDCQRSGHLVAAEALQPVRSATTVRVRNGEAVFTDGPFAETKEQLTGFYLLDVDTIEEALAMAAKIPAARVGSVEIRPVRTLQP